jgi:hypothetical protein
MAYGIAANALNLLPLSAGLCCKSLFAARRINSPICGRGDRILMWGTTPTGDELTGNFDAALEGTSIGDCRLLRPFARNSAQGILGVLQHNRRHSGHDRTCYRLDPVANDPEPP